MPDVESKHPRCAADLIYMYRQYRPVLDTCTSRDMREGAIRQPLYLIGYQTIGQGKPSIATFALQ